MDDRLAVDALEQDFSIFLGAGLRPAVLRMNAASRSPAIEMVKSGGRVLEARTPTHEYGARHVPTAAKVNGRKIGQGSLRLADIQPWSSGSSADALAASDGKKSAQNMAPARSSQR